MILIKEYYWTSEEPHTDNTETMKEFIECYLEPSYEVIIQDGPYAEVIDNHKGIKYSVRAYGIGDFNNHNVVMEAL